MSEERAGMAASASEGGAYAEKNSDEAGVLRGNPAGFPKNVSISKRGAWGSGAWGSSLQLALVPAVLYL